MIRTEQMNDVKHSVIISPVTSTMHNATVSLLGFLLLSLYLSAVAPTSDAELESWLLGMREKKCFGDLGCFDLEYPWFTWERPVPVLPQPPDVIDTTFYLLTRGSRLSLPERLQTRPLIDLSGSAFNKENKVFLIVHGFIGHYTDEWAMDIARELINLVDANVILVDWSNGSNMINYIQAVANARLVGMEIDRLIKALDQMGPATPCNIHGIGFSLGAQVLAYAANASRCIHRITALDPAQPGFDGCDSMVRLDEKDAPFVDVIHTNGAPLFPSLGFGATINVGHSDFFVNGGEFQPGCRLRKANPFDVDKKQVMSKVGQYLSDYDRLSTRVDSVDQLMETALEEEIADIMQQPAAWAPFAPSSLLDFLTAAASSVFQYVSCSHEKAPQYFLESLRSRNCSFWGVPWSPHATAASPDNCSYTSCSQMGLYSEIYPARGNFYVTTNYHEPYCKSSERLESTMKTGLTNEILRRTESQECWS